MHISIRVTIIYINKFKKILKENDERFILLTADEFFDGNTFEERTDDLPIKSRNELSSRNISSDRKKILY